MNTRMRFLSVTLKFDYLHELHNKFRIFGVCKHGEKNKLDKKKLKYATVILIQFVCVLKRKILFIYECKILG
jgi:hypothetical protein